MTQGVELDERTLNLVQKILAEAYTYFQLAPAFFYTGAALLAWWIAWRNLAKMRGSSGDS